MRTLQDISTRLISEMSLESLFAQILDAALELSDADAAGLQMVSADGESLGLLGWKNFPEAAVNYWSRVAIDGECACARALRERRRIPVRDIETCEFLKGKQDLIEYRRAGIQAFQVTPLYSRRGQPLGVLSTHWRRPHMPADEVFKLLDVLARQAADLIERTRAEEAIRISEGKYRSLFESMDEAFYLIEIIRDKDGQPEDLLYLDENAAGIRLVGMPVTGRRLGALNPAALVEWLPILDRIARTGTSDRFEKFSTTTRKWQHFHVFPAGSGKDRVGVLSKDITRRKLAEDKLRESEEKFRAIANTSPVVIWMSDADSKCVFVNQPWLDFTGQSLEETLADGGWSKPIHPDDVAVCTSIFRKARERLDPCQMDYRLRRADGEYRWMVSRGAPRFNADGSFAGYVGSSIDVTERRLAEQALATINVRLANAQADERARIARELHDDVVQRLVGLGWRLGAAASPDTASASAFEDIESIRAEVMTLARDVQTLSHRLHPASMEFLGIAAAARSLCRRMAHPSGVEISCHVEEAPDGLSHENAVCLHRVLQESLQNAIKHSGAAKVEVYLRAAENEIEMTVTDRGVGFNPGSHGSGGLGLISMEERLQSVGGRLVVCSDANGTTIRAYVPIAKAEPDNSGAVSDR